MERMIAEEAVIETTAALDQCHGCIVPELYEKMIQLVKEKD